MSKKYIAFFMAVAIFAGVVPAFAQTTSTPTSSSLQTLIQTLQTQLQGLQGKVQTRNEAQVQVQTAKQDVVATLRLIAELNEGSRGDDVRLLQTILAADPDIYPEGTISGLYGRLTAQAVRKFQKKHGLPQVGRVGPKTLEKLNKALEDNPVAKEKDEQGKDRHCAMVPPGHLVAKGWLKKHDGIRPIVPACQTLPPGILKKLPATSTPPTPTSTPDIVAPILSLISATSTTSSTATIMWTTNEPSTTKVWYSTSTPVTTSTASVVSSSALVTAHSVTLTGLTASTTYRYVIGSTDASANTAMSTEYSFVTGQ